MTIHYITSSANSGDGTLRDLIAAASDGDIIEPSLTAFPRGTICEITLGSILNVNKSLTIRGAHTKIRFNGDSLYQVYATSTAEDATFEDCEFVNLKGTYGSLRVACSNLTLRRVAILGGETSYGGAMHFVANVESLTCYNCVFAGNKATTNTSGIYVNNANQAANTTLVHCTFVGNVSGDGLLFRNGRVPEIQKYCKTDSNGMVAPPNIDMDSWTADSWKEWDLHILPSHADASVAYSNDDMEAYFSETKTDIQGFFRDDSSGKIVDALGAYAALSVDLYWIGKDSSGGDVSSPSFAVDSGWATSPVASASSGIAPTSGSVLYVGENVTFNDVPPNGATLVVGDCARVHLTNETKFLVSLITGRGAYVNLSNVAVNQGISPETLWLGKNSYLNGSVSCYVSGTDNLNVDFKADESAYVARFYTRAIAPIPQVDYYLISVFSNQSVTFLPGEYNVSTTVSIRAENPIAFPDGVVFKCNTFSLTGSVSNKTTNGFDGAFTVMPKVAVTLVDGIPETWKDAFVVDLSNASSNVTLTRLTGQVVRNNSNGATLVGSARVQNETVDSSKWNVAQGSTLTLENCVVDWSTVDNYNLYVNGGTFVSSNLSVNASYASGASSPTYKVAFTNCALNVSTLALKDCELVVDSAFSYSTGLFVNAKLSLSSIRPLNLNSVSGDLDLELTGVSGEIDAISANNVTLTNTTLDNSTFLGNLVMSGSSLETLSINNATTTATNSVIVVKKIECDALTLTSSTLNKNDTACEVVCLNVVSDDSTWNVLTLKAKDNETEGTLFFSGNGEVEIDSWTLPENQSAEISATSFASNSGVYDGDIVVNRGLFTFGGTVNGELTTTANVYLTPKGTLTFNSAVSLSVMSFIGIESNTTVVFNQASSITATDAIALRGTNDSITANSGLTLAARRIEIEKFSGTLDANGEEVQFNESSSFTNSKIVASTKTSFNGDQYGSVLASVSFTSGLEITSPSISADAFQGTGVLKLTGDLANAANIGTQAAPVHLDWTGTTATAGALYLDDFNIEATSLTATSLDGAGTITANANIPEITSDDLTIVGNVVSSNLVAQKLSITGEANVDNLTSPKLILNGDLSSETVVATGTLSGTTLDVETATLAGSLDYDSIEIDSLTVTDALSVEGDLTLGDLTATGTFTIASGTFNATSLTLNGSAVGVVEANEIDHIYTINVAKQASLTLPGKFAANEITSSGTLKFQGETNAVVRIREDFEIASLQNDNEDVVLVSIPYYPDDDIEITGNIELQVINGTARNFLASASGSDSVIFTWQDSVGSPVRIEAYNGESYDLLTKTAQAEYEDGVYNGSVSIAFPNVAGTTFRLFDGDKYLYDVAYTVTNPAFYQYEVADIYYPGESLKRNENLLALALLKDSVSGDLLAPSDVMSVKATLYKKIQSNVGVYTRSAVSNWTDVEIDPRCVVDESSCRLMDSFNFCWVPDQTSVPFITEKGSYEIQFRISLTENRNPAVVTFKFDCE